MIDQFFTPHYIAKRSFANVNVKHHELVADFSVGDGSLLKSLPFNIKLFVGLDLDNRVIKDLRRTNPDWKVSCGNFICPSNYTRRWLKQWEGRVDLVLLNPPFSCRGGTRIIVDYEDQSVVARPALVFLLNALKYLSEHGTLLAILPLSLMKSEADLTILRLLEKRYVIEQGVKHNRNSFVGCNPSSIVVIIKRRTKANSIKVTKKNNHVLLSKAQLLRGSTPIYTTKNDGRFGVIHTTSLQNGRLITPLSIRTDKLKRFASGVFVCLPRIGKPDKRKVLVVESQNAVVLSDCIFAIRGSNESETKHYRDLILANWQNFEVLYESTCAPYITIGQIVQFMNSHNVSLELTTEFS